MAHPLPYTPPGINYQDPVQNPANGHWYQLGLAVSDVNWDEARTAVEALTYNGYPGHLATITSAAENNFFLQHGLSWNGGVWLGAYQERGAPDFLEPAGGWRWVTGEPWNYANWGTGQPANYPSPVGHTDGLLFKGSRGWNDAPYAYGMSGFVVEYEPAPPSTGLPPLPLPPRNLTASLVSFTQINLSWVDRSNNEEGVEVYRQSPGYYWWLVARLTPNTTTFADTTVVPFSTYIYQVRAFNRRGPSAYFSNAAWLDTALPPAAPTGLSVATGTRGVVALVWTDQSSDETGFDIQRQLAGTRGWEQIGVAAANSSHYNDRTARAGFTFRYRVRAHCARGASAWTNEVSAVAR
jgi:hypothetical protein